MTGDLQSRVQELAREVERARALRSKAEGRLEQLRQEHERLLAELAALGVEEDQLDRRIQQLEQEIRQALDEAEALLSGAGNGEAAPAADSGGEGEKDLDLPF